MSSIRREFLLCQTFLHSIESGEYYLENLMSRASASPDAWHPQTKEDRDGVLRELKKILASPQFANSKRYPALLQYVVENTLEGRLDLLKERTLGVEVFDRPPAYDTNTDTVVRYTAGEVRKRLSLYYHELDRNPVIQISLPPGSYVPEFLHSQDEADELAERGSPLSPDLGRTEIVRNGVKSTQEPDSIAQGTPGATPLHAAVDLEVRPS